MAIPPPHARGRDLTLWLLAAAAGCVDAVSYLALGHVFVANMTGNTVLLGIALVELEPGATLRAALSLAGFVGGAAGGAWVIERARPLRRGAGVSRVLTLQVMLMAIAVLCWRAQNDTMALADFLVLLLSLAMGLQTVAARRLDRYGISTTFITGSITALVSRAVAGVHGALLGEEAPGERAAGAGVLAVLWGLYVAGAALGAWLARTAPSAALGVPLALVAVATVMTVRDRGD
jgi:uncharacterized membrane protein YoaK (UPF0700 family)